MRKLESVVELVTTEQLNALRTTAYPALRADENRGRDPLWHLGHLCVDFAKVLVVPFNRDRFTPFQGDPSLDSRFPPSEFATLSGNRPWESIRPTMEELATWLEDIRDASLKTLRDHAPTEKLPEPVALFTASITTVQEALLYSVYHNSYHFGCAHSLVGERLVNR